MNLFVGILKFYLPQLFIHLLSRIQQTYRRPQKWKSISTSWPAIIKLLHCTKKKKKKKEKRVDFLICFYGMDVKWSDLVEFVFSDGHSPDSKGNSFYSEIYIHNFLFLFQVQGTHSFNFQSQLLDFPSI